MKNKELKFNLTNMKISIISGTILSCVFLSTCTHAPDIIQEKTKKENAYKQVQMSPTDKPIDFSGSMPSSLKQ